MSFRRSAVVLLLAAGFGCTSAPPPPVQFSLEYLNGNPQTTRAPVAARLGVAQFTAQPFYQRQRLAWRNGHQHDYHSEGKWEAAPPILLTEAVLDAARHARAFETVQTHPPVWGAPPSLVVRGRVEAFDDDRNGKRAAHVAGRFAVTDASGRTIYWEGDLEERHPVSGSGIAGLVTAFQRAQTALADEIVAIARGVAVDQAAAQQAAGAAGQ